MTPDTAKFVERRLASRLTPAFWGAVLFAAGSLKAYDMLVDPLGEQGVFGSREWQIALIAVELFLGGWLLSGLARQYVKLAALSFFTAVGGVALWQIVRGTPSCSCFGSALGDISLVRGLPSCLIRPPL